MITAERVDDKIHITSDWSDKERIKGLPGSGWNAADKVWTLPLTWAACVQLRGEFGNDLVIGTELRLWAKQERFNRVDPAVDLRGLFAPSTPLSMLEKLYPFQQAGVEFMAVAGSVLLADDMGTGKTIQLLSVLRMKFSGQKPALIVCPNTIKGNWAKEAKTWYPECTPYVVAGTAVARRKILDKAAADASALVIINIESVRLHSRTMGFGSISLTRCEACGGHDEKITEAKCETHDKELNKIPFAAVVVDEAHRIKDGKAKQTRAIWGLTHGDPDKRRNVIRYAATGTAVANSAEDSWAVMHFVSPDEYPTKSKYVERYCKTEFNEWGGFQVGGFKPEMKSELEKFLDPRMRRMNKSDVLSQLPEKVFLTRYVEMGKEQAKAYEQMADGMVTRLPDGTMMTASSNLAVNTRLIQFSSALMQGDEDAGFTMCEPSPKLDVMDELLEEMNGKPLVVAAVHKQLIDLAEARLQKAGISYGKITGDVPQWQRDAYVQQFQDGKLRVMLLTMQAGGVGITLTRADTMLRLQCSWSMVDNKQTVDRIHRIGSEIHQKVNIIDVITAGTIEEDQVVKVQQKHMILQDFHKENDLV